MNYKKAGLIFLLLLTLTSLSSQFVAAAEPWDTIGSIVTLSFIQKINPTFVGPYDPIQGIVRFLLLLLLFSLYYKGIELTGLGRNVSVVIAGVFAILSAMFVPLEIILAAAAGYGTIISVILLGIPVAICLLSYILVKDHPWGRVVIMGLLITSLHYMNSFLTPITSTGTFIGDALDSVRALFVWVLVVAYIMAFVTLAQAASTIGGASATRPNWVGRIYDRVAQKTVLTEKGKELRHAQREKTRLLNNAVEEEKEFKLILAVDQKVVDYRQIVKMIQGDKEVKSKDHLEQMDNTFKTISDAVKALKNEKHAWKSAQRRESRQIEKLLKEMVDKGVSDRDRAGLDIRRKAILNAYINVGNAVKEIINTFGSIEQQHTSFYSVCSKKYSSGSVVDTDPLDVSKSMAFLDTLLNETTELRNYIAVAAKQEANALALVKGQIDDIKSKWLV